MLKVNKQGSLQLALLGLLSFSLATNPVHSQNTTFPRFARCLEGSSLTGPGDPEGNYEVSCISCSVVVRVDPGRGGDCAARRDDNLNGVTCTELDPVLDSIMVGRTTSMNCVEVAVTPRSAEDGGRYVVTANKTIYRQSVFMRSRSETEMVGVSIELPAGVSGNESLLYALAFNNSEGVIFSRIKIVGSPGALAFNNLRLVAIVESSFRFFSGGAVDVYNSLIVLVANSNFSHNVVWNVSKEDTYRGYAAGLSVGKISIQRYRKPWFAATAAYMAQRALGLEGYNQNTTLLPVSGVRVRVLNCLFQNNSVDAQPAGSTYDSDQSGFIPDLEIPTSEDNPGSSSSDSNGGGGDSNSSGGGGGGGGDGKVKGPDSMRTPMTQSQLFTIRGQVFNSLFFSGRGGGAALLFNSDRPADVVVWQTNFLENSVVEFGGGAYVLLQGSTSHLLVITQCRFEGNSALSTAGGLHATFLLTDSELEQHELQVRDSIFRKNKANFGGAIFFLVLERSLFTVDSIRLGSYGLFSNCSFRNNQAVEAGGALGVAFNKPLFSLEETQPVDIINSEFISNSVRGAGIVTTAFFPLTFRGTNIFSENSGPSLGVVGSRVQVFGRLQMSGNSNINSLDGGSLYFTSLGQLELQNKTSLVLNGNQGVIGSAVVIQNIQLSQAFSQLRYNPLCAFQYKDRFLPPNRWNNFGVSVNISENRAIVASGVSINNINFCSWTGGRAPYFNRDSVFRWRFISYRRNHNSAHGDPISERYAVQTPPVRMRFRGRRDVSAYSGEEFELGVLAQDEFNFATYAVVGIGDDSQNSSSEKSRNMELYQFSPSSAGLNDVSRNADIDIKFGISEEGYGSITDDSLIFPIEVIRVRNLLGQFGTSSISDITFNLSPTPCPAGYRLDGAAFRGTFGACACDLNRSDIIDCNRTLITVKDYRWGYTDALDQKANETKPTNSGGLHQPFYTAVCPREYCNCRIDRTSGITMCSFVFDGMAPETQCHCNRTGILCGGCVSGTGFSTLLDRCVSCDDRYTIFVLVLVVANVAAILTVLVLMLPVPDWLYPTIFYLQVIPIFTNSFPVSFERLSPYLLYIGSTLGLYFPYDFCLHSNMPATGVYALRYIPAFLAVTITPLFLFIRSRKFRSVDWHGVWVLILLLFTPTVYTSVKLLDCPSLQGESPFTPRWFVNANIRCFNEGQHVPLGLFALAVLAVSVVGIAVLVLIATGWLTRPDWIRHMVEPITRSYKEPLKWWSGVELAKRTALVIFAVAFKDDVVYLALLLAALLTLNGLFQPFTSVYVNVLDMVFGVNVFILLCLRSTSEFGALLQSEIVERDTDSSGCATSIEYTNYVIFLGLLYYLPLLTALVALIAYSVQLSLLFYRKDLVPMMEEMKEKNKKPELQDPQISSVEYSVDMQRHRTQTIVEMSSCESATPVAVRQKFSFRIKRPSLQYVGSRKRKKVEAKTSNKGDVSEIPFEDLTEYDLKAKVGLEEPAVTYLDQSL